MKPFYKSSKGIKFSEEDVYQEGCLPDTTQTCDVDVEFKSDSVAGLLKKMYDYFGISKEDADLNACDEKGRIDICILENADGYKASKSDIVCWKDRDKKLWSVIYTYYISKVTKETIIL